MLASALQQPVDMHVPCSTKSQTDSPMAGQLQPCRGTLVHARSCMLPLGSCMYAAPKAHLRRVAGPCHAHAHLTRSSARAYFSSQAGRRPLAWGSLRRRRRWAVKCELPKLAPLVREGRSSAAYIMCKREPCALGAGCMCQGYGDDGADDKTAATTAASSVRRLGPHA